MATSLYPFPKITFPKNFLDILYGFPVKGAHLSLWTILTCFLRAGDLPTYPLECHVKWCRRKEKDACRGKSLFILLSLLTSISLTPTEFVECQNLFPDEILDLSAISSVSPKQIQAQRVTIVHSSYSLPSYSPCSAILGEAVVSNFPDFPIALAPLLRC